MKWKKKGIDRKKIKEAILYNKPIEDKLNVIICISNPCEYKRRWELALDFIDRIEKEEYVNLYVIELIYPNQNFHITEQENKRHLQIKTEIPLWHKESMLNVGIKKLLPKEWKSVAWIDADLEFENVHWALDTLKILNGTADVVQLFTQALDCDHKKNVFNIWQSSMYQYCNNMISGKGINYWHCGYAWACTREAYDKMGFYMMKQY